MRHIKFMAAAVALLIGPAAFAQPPAGGTAQILSAAPSGSVTVMGLYKQAVYDYSDKKIGEIADVLVGKDGKLNAFVIGTGTFVGKGKHDVLVPMSSVMVAKKNGKDYLVMDVTKDELMNATGFRYDPVAMTWLPDDGKRANARSSEGDRNKARSLSGR